MLSYYRDSEIVDYLFAAHNGGNSSIPLFAGAVFLNSTIKVCDIHLLRFRYTKGYVEAISKDQLAGESKQKWKKRNFREILKTK